MLLVLLRCLAMLAGSTLRSEQPGQATIEVNQEAEHRCRS